MKPYYEQDGITIYNADCREVLPTLEPVDLVFTSPPYNLGGTRGTHFDRLSDGYASYSDDLPLAEYIVWQKECLTDIWNALSDTGAIFYQHKPITKGNEVRLPTDLNPGLPLRQIITWDRGSGFQRTHWHYVPRYEWILLFSKDGFRINNLSTDDLWQIPFDTGKAHPAAYPLALPKTAIASTDAETILDPFMGSGTTLRAAKDLGRNAIGIEIEERYCEIAANRLAQGVLL